MPGYDDFSSPAPSAPAASGYDAFSSPVKPESWMEYGEGLAEKAAQGATLGYADELAAGIGAGTNWLAREAGMDIPERGYGQILGEIRGRQKTFEEKHPVAAAAAEVGGAASTLVAGPARVVAQAPTWLGRAAQSAKIGAGYGALSGFGSSEGGVTNRLEGAAEGAGTGAVLGPVATEIVAPVVGAVARGARSGARGLGQAVQSIRGQSANVDARLSRALEAQNTPPGVAARMLDEAQAASRFGRTQLNPQMTIADLGPVTRDLADTASLVSPEARGLSGEFLSGRARGQYERINDYLRRSMKVTRGDFANTQAKLIDEQQKLSKTAYDAFRNMDVRIPVGDVLYDAQIEDMAAAPALKRTLEQAREQFIAGRTTRDLGVDVQTRKPVKVEQAQTNLSPARFDAGKRALDDMIEAAQKGGRNNEARLLTSLKRRLVDVADKATTVTDPATGTARSLYAEARDVYGSRAQLLDALDSGRAFMKGDAEMTAKQYNALSTGEKRMFRIGVTREVRKALGGKRLGTDMISYFDKPNTREVLGEIMSPKQRDRFYELVELEQGLAATNNAVRGNSATARRQQNVLDFSLGTRLGRMIKDQGLYHALKTEIFDQITKFTAMRDSDAVALTKAMFDTDPAAQRATLNRIAQTYGKGHTRAVINRAERILRQKMIARRQKLLLPTVGEQSGNYRASRSEPQYQMQP